MSTIHLHRTTTSAPELFVAGLTDFGPGRSKLFGNSADEYLKVHHKGSGEADVTEGSGGVWERLHYDWSDPNRVVMTTTVSSRKQRQSHRSAQRRGERGRRLMSRLILTALASGLFLVSSPDYGQTMTIPDTDRSVVQASSASRGAADDRSMIFETLTVRKEGAVVFAEINAPPMNLLGPELVRDLVSLIRRAEGDKSVRVLVFKSADPDYFISHVDVTRIKEYREEAAKLIGEASIGLLFRHLSASRLVTIAQIEGRVRAAGSEFVLACDMRFAARESAIFGQPEPGLGTIPGAGAVQHLTRLMGRARALEVLLSADDYNAELAERYGWINRALPARELDGFVSSLARRIASFPAAGQVVVKERVNAIALAPVEDFRRDSDLFGEGVGKPEAQKQIQAAIKHGFQTPEGEKSLGRLLGDLADR